MVPTRQEHIDPETEAMFDQNKKIETQNAREHEAFQIKAREIGQTQGEAARRAYEQEWEAQRQQKAAMKKKGLEELKRQLLDQGLDPFCDPEANRQIILYEKGIDLAEVPGTKYYMERDFEKSQPKRSMKYQKAPNRFIIKCMVEDMEKKGKDPLRYFESHQEQTSDILNMSFQKATLLAQQYKANMEQYGQLTVPKDGETTTPIDDELSEETQKQQTKAAEANAKAKRLEEKQRQKEEKQRQKEEAKRLKAQEKQKKAEAKAEAKRQREEEKKNKEANIKAAALAGASAVADSAAKGVDAVTGTHIYEEKQQELGEEEAAAAPEMTRQEKRAQAKRQKEEAKKQQKAAKAAAAAAAAAAGAAAKAGVDTAAKGIDTVTGSQIPEVEGVQQPEAASDETTKSVAKMDKMKGFPVGKAVGAVITVGGGAFAVKILKEKADRDEEARQREFRLIMGLSEDLPQEPRLDVDKTPESDDKGDDMDLDDPDFMEEKVSAEVPIPESKKRRGFKSMFGKRKGSDRETDLTVLVSEGATAPEFALLLSKLLTFGAPGRFPLVTSLPGDMPMAEFELEAAKSLLEKAAADGDITKEQGAEIFANVVNCMLIDIVDLASSALKEDDKVLVDAINVVVDFMNHAASLYDSVAEVRTDFVALKMEALCFNAWECTLKSAVCSMLQGVVITPVTYGGELGKGKLEQMFSKYAVSGMMSMDEDFNARVGLLQDVFSIPEKKAEGLMMKAMQKNMMKMLKTGEGMEGMEEMMKGLGGDMEGLGSLGMGMDGEDGPSPEQLKEMLLTLKTMKESGTIPPEELEAVRAQFKEAFGAGIDDVVSDAEEDEDALNESDKELLELMKEILKD